MTDFKRDLEEDLKLDKFELEAAAQEQAAIFGYWSEELAEAKEARDLAERRLAIKSAEIELQIRRSPPSDVKITESVIAALLAENAQLQKLHDNLAARKKDVVMLETALRAVEQRKSMIETLSRLWVAGYYSTPTESPVAQSTRRTLNRHRTEDEE